MKTEIGEGGKRYITHESSSLDDEVPLVCDSIREHCLWISDTHRLDRNDVNDLIGILAHWLAHNRLPDVG